MSTHQISVFLENRAGQLAEITNVLSENHIDLRALSIAETSDYGVLRLIVNKPHEASAVLLEHGFVLSMTPVTIVAVPDEPGGLAKVLNILSDANIDIEYMYSVFGQEKGLAYMIFRVANDEQLRAVLTEKGITIGSGKDLGVH